jgi:peptide-methionine (S)-S-oxide reductase
MFTSRHKTELVTAERALPGRQTYEFTVPATHAVNGRPITGPFPAGLRTVVFGLGCFWGAEEVFWQQPGVWTTAVGYAGGHTSYPTYEEVCSGLTGHTEAVLVVYDPAEVAFADLVATFFEVHDPTQGMRQGNDVGTQYRSAVYVTDPAQLDTAKRSLDAYGEVLRAAGFGSITTEVDSLPEGGFYYAEDYHQQYLAKNPNGYCGLGGTGVACPAGLVSSGD